MGLPQQTKREKQTQAATLLWLHTHTHKWMTRWFRCTNTEMVTEFKGESSGLRKQNLPQLYSGAAWAEDKWSAWVLMSKIPNPKNLLYAFLLSTQENLALGLGAAAVAAMLPHREACHSGLHLLCRQLGWGHKCCWIIDRELRLMTLNRQIHRIQKSHGSSVHRAVLSAFTTLPC